MEALAQQLLATSEHLRAAIADLPRQRRDDAASPKPVEWIDAALLRTWETGGEPGTRYPFVRSVGLKSAFRQVVGVVYEAATCRVGADPERAIRSFLAQSRTRDRQNI